MNLWRGLGLSEPLPLHTPRCPSSPSALLEDLQVTGLDREGPLPRLPGSRSCAPPVAAPSHAGSRLPSRALSLG